MVEVFNYVGDPNVPASHAKAVAQNFCLIAGLRA
jgi:hypothetical protein